MSNFELVIFAVCLILVLPELAKFVRDIAE